MLQGQRVVLRPIEKEHLPNYVRWLADTEVLMYFGSYLPINLAGEESWYENQNQNPAVVNFAVELAGQLAVGQRGEVPVVPRVVPHRADPPEVCHERGVCRHEAPGHEEGRRHVLPAQSRKDRWRPAAVRSPVEGEGHDLGRGRQHRDDPGRSCRRRPTG